MIGKLKKKKGFVSMWLIAHVFNLEEVSCFFRKRYNCSKCQILYFSLSLVTNADIKVD